MMKRVKYLSLSLCLWTGFSGLETQACSVFTASRVDKVFAATNKDWNNTCTRIRIYAPTEDKFGRLYFGYEVSQGFQNVGGMNEHGLWYDGASLPSRSDIYNHYHKPTIQGELCEKALEECRTVEEVIQLYKKYYTPHWQGHSMWADRMGNSVIIEYGEKDVVFLQKEHGYQVMTNFYLSDTTNLRWCRCHRYNVITEILGKADKIDVEIMTRALEASHKEGLTPTLFSNVYDLKKAEIYVYHFSLLWRICSYRSVGRIRNG
jgi:penicillin V acylase-like amidase (Ntn superfamily)